MLTPCEPCSLFQPQNVIPRGRLDEAEAGAYQIALNVPVRQSKIAVREGEEPALVNAGIIKGNLVKQVRPEYPEFARHNRIRGTIILQGIINQQGEVKKLKAGDGPFVLIEAAYNAVKQWQYRPYLVHGQPVEVLTEIQVSFN